MQRKPSITGAVLHQVEVLGSSLASTLYLWRGTGVLRQATQPKQPLELYDIESDADCRAVREALTALGLDAVIYPCPQGGTRHARQLKRLGGKPQLPLLRDCAHGTVLRGAGPVLEHLFHTYGKGPVPPAFGVGTATRLAGAIGTTLRGARGMRARASRQPRQMLELWSFESSPYSRLVRERLCELELAYSLHNLGKEQFADMGPAVLRVRPGPYRPKPGGKRSKMLRQVGRVQLPYLQDPNTGAKLFESAAICDYLEAQYAL